MMNKSGQSATSMLLFLATLMAASGLVGTEAFQLHPVPRRAFVLQSAEPTMFANSPNDLLRLVDDDMSSPLTTQPTPMLVQALQDANGIKKATIATLCGFLLLLAPMQDAQAAMSGGRMGGSYSSPAPMRTAPSPSPSSYGGGSYSSYRDDRDFYAPRPAMIAPSPYGGAVVVNQGPNIFDLFFWGAVGTVVFSFIKDGPKEGQEIDSALGPGASVVQVSVALNVPNRDQSSSILSVLGKLAETARTDSRVGLANLTSQVALELMRQKASLTSVCSSYEHFSDAGSAQRKYNQVAVKERSKFEQETVAKYGGVDYSEGQKQLGSGGSTDQATQAVVTVVINIRGTSLERNKSVSSMSDIKELLTSIASDSKVDDCLQGAEILWTPADRSETLSPRDVIADYPELRAL